MKQYFAYESRHQHGAFDMTGGFNYFLFSSLLGEMIHYDYSNIFQMGWNHQLENPFGERQHML